MKVFWSTPTMSRPRASMAAIVEPGGIAPGDGCVPGRRLASALQSAWAACGVVVISCAPAGLTGAGASDTDGGGGDDAPQPATASAAASNTVTTCALTGTP